MQICGLIKTSLLDYPEHISATIFTGGCNFQCPFCHNKDLVLRPGELEHLSKKEVLSFLQKRKGILTGVCVSGGEPTLHHELPDFLAEIKTLGYFVKLDTNGSNPHMLMHLMNHHLIDYIAMDIKGPLENYQKIVAYPVDVNAVQESIDIIIASNIEREFRTTVVKSQIYFDPQRNDDFDKIGMLIKGQPRFALQKFRAGRTLNPRFERETTYTDEEFELIKDKMKKYVNLCVVH